MRLRFASKSRTGARQFLFGEFSRIFTTRVWKFHPGRYLRDQFGIFGGSNGYWRTEALHLTRMRGSMLTEDIDASMRLLEAEGIIGPDPTLISRELATTTARQIWNQRLRWAQGWFQVSMRHVFKMLRMPHFSVRQKLGIFNLLLQREAYPWISLQIFPLVAFWIYRGDVLDWTVPIFLATTIFTATVGPGQVGFAYRLAHPDIKKHRSWFWQYLFFLLLIYTEAKTSSAGSPRPTSHGRDQLAGYAALGRPRGWRPDDSLAGRNPAGKRACPASARSAARAPGSRDRDVRAEASDDHLSTSTSETIRAGRGPFGHPVRLELLPTASAGLGDTFEQLEQTAMGVL